MDSDSDELCCPHEDVWWLWGDWGILSELRNSPCCVSRKHVRCSRQEEVRTKQLKNNYTLTVTTYHFENVESDGNGLESATDSVSRKHVIRNTVILERVDGLRTHKFDGILKSNKKITILYNFLRSKDLCWLPHAQISPNKASLDLRRWNKRQGRIWIWRNSTHRQ